MTVIITATWPGHSENYFLGNCIFSELLTPVVLTPGTLCAGETQENKQNEQSTPQDCTFFFFFGRDFFFPVERKPAFAFLIQWRAVEFHDKERSEIAPRCKTLKEASDD